MHKETHHRRELFGEMLLFSADHPYGACLGALVTETGMHATEGLSTHRKTGRENTKCNQRGEGGRKKGRKE